MATRSEIENLTAKELRQLISMRDREILEDSLDSLERNRISGKRFLLLEEDELRELFPLVGERKAIKNLIDSYRSNAQQPGAPKPGCNVWLHTFRVPERFSTKTMEAIATGIISKGVRVEVITNMSVLMMQHTTTPTSEEYNVVCAQLVEAYPTLRDTVGSGYDTWKQQLRDKFKNLRRAPKTSPCRCVEGRQTMMEDTTIAKPATRKRARQDKTEESPQEDIDYEHLCVELQGECSKERSSSKVVQRLMNKTFQKRRKWIIFDLPSVGTVLETFPPLRTSKYIWQELVMTIGDDPEDTGWRAWSSSKLKVILLASKERESRSNIANLQEVHEQEVDSYGPELKGELDQVHTLELLHLLLTAQPQAKPICRISGSTNVDDELRKLRNTWPYLVLIGHRTTFQLMLVAERQVICRVSTLWEGLKGLLGAYFAFNIEYPKPLRALLIFVQHHIFNVKDRQSIPNSVKQIKSSLDKLN